VKIGLNIIDGEKFYVEPITPNSYHMVKVENIVYSHKSKYQLIEIIDTYDYGRVLILDHSTQVSDRDEYIYHEIFTHPILISHPNPRKILIIGGGDGGLLREVLKHRMVEEAVLVEIDGEVIEVVEKYLPSIPQGAFKDPRSRIIIGDGAEFVEKTDEIFDVIFMDVTDDIGPSTPLYQLEFYRKVKEILNSGGIFVTQSLGVEQHPNARLKIISDLKKIFRLSDFYAVYVPSFNNRWSFTFASDILNPLEIDLETVKRRFWKRNLKTKYYSPEIHYALKYLKMKC